MLNTLEEEDELLGRIMDGDVNALVEATDSQLKATAVQAARPKAEAREKAEQEAFDEWAGQFDI